MRRAPHTRVQNEGVMVEHHKATRRLDVREGRHGARAEAAGAAALSSVAAPK